jgi:methionyl-tRNA formyltransferase
MKIVFFGTPEIGAEVLQYLIDKELDVVMVVTKPDKPKGRSGTLMPPPVKIVAKKYHIPVLQPEIISTEESASILRHLNPDLYVVVAYGEIIKKNILEIPKHGAINLHASLLPKYRGASPIQRALLNGEKETGVSIIRLVQKMDAGPILLQKNIPLNDQVNVQNLFSLVGKVGKEALIEAIDMIDKSTVKEIFQNEDEVTYAGKINREDEIITFNQPASLIQQRIMAMYPYAYFTIPIHEQLTKILCLSSQVVDIKLTPGQLLNDKKRLIIGTTDGSIEILRLKQEGKKELSTEEWLRGSYPFLIH